MMGSSAAALTGLMFVVITLVTDSIRSRPRPEDGLSTFSTPTVYHFCAALLISGIALAPWHSLWVPGIAIALLGLVGTVYIARIALRTWGLTSYRAEIDDWIFYSILPCVAYVVTLVSGLLLAHFTRIVLFALAGATFLLVFIGIRNAWDVVTYLAIRPDPEPDEESTSASGSESAKA
ncbi:MAG TPA: hypothetical protein VGG22_08605 [Candidatus Baltobacteraceae bacterium]|jgi:hypothetical protein